MQGGASSYVAVLDKDIYMLELIQNSLSDMGLQEGELEILLDLKKEATELLDLYKDIQAGIVPLIIAVVGTFNSGKSSFINRLLGDKQICPVGACPTTSSITIFQFSEEEGIWEICEGPSGSVNLRPITYDEYNKLVTHSSDTEQKGQAARFAFEVKGKFELLKKGILLFDTPGFENTENPYDDKVTEETLHEADAVFYLMDINKGSLTATELNLLKDIREKLEMIPICLVLNKADTKPKSSREEIRNKLRRDYSSLFRWFILFCSKPEKKVEGIDSVENVRKIFDWIAEQKQELLNARWHQKYLLYLQKKTRSYVAPLLKMLHRKCEAIENDIDDLNFSLSRISSIPSDLYNRVSLALRSVAIELVKTCVYAREIPNSGIFFDDGVLELDSYCCSNFYRSINSNTDIFRWLDKDIKRRLEVFTDREKESLYLDWGKGFREAVDAFSTMLEFIISEVLSLMGRFWDITSAIEAKNMLIENFPSLWQIIDDCTRKDLPEPPSKAIYDFYVNYIQKIKGRFSQKISEREREKNQYNDILDQILTFIGEKKIERFQTVELNHGQVSNNTNIYDGGW